MVAQVGHLARLCRQLEQHRAHDRGRRAGHSHEIVDADRGRAEQADDLIAIGRAAGGVGHEAHEILGWVMLALVAILVIFFAVVGFMPNYLGHPDNYIEANPLATPAHIVPEWYFLPFYAILRAFTADVWVVMAVNWLTFGIVDAKFFGVLAMFGAIIVLALVGAPVVIALLLPQFGFAKRLSIRSKATADTSSPQAAADEAVTADVATAGTGRPRSVAML